MSKLSHLTLALLFTLPILTGCSHLQDPTPETTLTPAGTGSNLGPDTVTPITSGGENNPQLNGSGLIPRPAGSDIPADVQDRINSNTLRPEDILVTVYFDFDSYNVLKKVPAATGDQQAALEDAAKKLAADPKLHVIAVGHTDWFGSDEYNLALSDRRAKSVIDFTTKNGASPDAMQLLAKGKLQATPDVKDKESPEARHDRRVDVVIISK